MPTPVPSQRNNIVLVSSRSAVATAVFQAAVWPRFIEVLIGIIAGGVPELIYFWWTFQAEHPAAMDDFNFTVSGIAALVVGGAAGLICRVCWPSARPASLYRMLNTLVWACAGSFVGYIMGSWIIGVNTPASDVLVPFCQAVGILLAMGYARCGGVVKD